MLGSEGLTGSSGRLGQLAHVQQALALAAQALLGRGLEALGALDQLAQLGQTLRPSGLGPGQLVELAPHGDEVPPGSCLLLSAAELRFAHIGVQHLELEGGTC